MKAQQKPHKFYMYSNTNKLLVEVDLCTIQKYGPVVRPWCLSYSP